MVILEHLVTIWAPCRLRDKRLTAFLSVHLLTMRAEALYLVKGSQKGEAPGILSEGDRHGPCCKVELQLLRHCVVLQYALCWYMVILEDPVIIWAEPS